MNVKLISYILQYIKCIIAGDYYMYVQFFVFNWKENSLKFQLQSNSIFSHNQTYS
jgi:hypothetical protein